MPKNLKSTIIPVLAVLGAATAAAPALAALSPDAAAITAIERGMTASQTASGILASWDKNAVWYDINPGEVDGLPAITKDLTAQFKGVTNLKATILRMTVGADGTLGYAFSTQHVVADVNGKKAAADFVFRETDIFQKKGGSWRLIHQQISIPVDMTTGKPNFESK